MLISLDSTIRRSHQWALDVRQRRKVGVAGVSRQVRPLLVVSPLLHTLLLWQGGMKEMKISAAVSSHPFAVAGCRCCGGGRMVSGSEQETLLSLESCYHCHCCSCCCCSVERMKLLLPVRSLQPLLLP